MRNFITISLGLMFSIGVAVVSPMASAATWGGSPGDPHSKAYMGVHIDAVSPDQVAALKLKDANGVLITGLDQDGPACKAGLQENDVIVTFNGANVNSPQDLALLIQNVPAGKDVPVTIVRGGQRKNVDVTLGSWGHMVSYAAVPGAPVPPVSRRSMGNSFVAPMPDIEVPAFTTLSARHGVVVETLCPQLSEYFGVPANRGVLVRTVEKGSPAAAAGLKAGDVIVKINNETVHDIADWRRAVPRNAGKVTLVVVREKREQTIELNFPGADSSSLGSWDGMDNQQFEKDMQAFQQEMQKLGPALAQNQREFAAMQFSDKDMEQLRKELERSMKLEQKDFEKLGRDVQKAMPSQKEIQRMTRDLQKTLPSQKAIEQMQKQVQAAMPDPKQMEEMARQIQKSMPSQKDMEQMRHAIEDSMKNMTPQIQHQMEQLQKELQQFKFPEMQSPDTEREF